MHACIWCACVCVCSMYVGPRPSKRSFGSFVPFLVVLRRGSIVVQTPVILPPTLVLLPVLLLPPLVLPYLPFNQSGAGCVTEIGAAWTWSPPPRQGSRWNSSIPIPRWIRCRASSPRSIACRLAKTAMTSQGENIDSSICALLCCVMFWCVLAIHPGRFRYCCLLYVGLYFWNPLFGRVGSRGVCGSLSQLLSEVLFLFLDM